MKSQSGSDRALRRSLVPRSSRRSIGGAWSPAPRSRSSPGIQCDWRKRKTWLPPSGDRGNGPATGRFLLRLYFPLTPRSADPRLAAVARATPCSTALASTLRFQGGTVGCQSIGDDLLSLAMPLQRFPEDRQCRPLVAALGNEAFENFPFCGRRRARGRASPR